jgi:hypothetical protein
MKRTLLLTPALTLLLGSTACWPHREKQPRPPTQIPAARPVQAPPPLWVPPPSELQTGTQPSQTQAPSSVDTQPKIETPPPPARKARRRVSKPAGAPEQTEAPAQVEPVPRLGEILSAEQSREYTQALDQSLALVQRSLTAIASRRLTADQRQTAGRVRVFARQAEDLRSRDLATAVNLAKRAELLAQDLLRQLQ